MPKSTPSPKSKSASTLKTIHLYTYGYCCQNNKRGSRSAIGIYIKGTPIGDKHNIGALTSLYSKQTSDVASLLAIKNIIDSAKRKKHPLHKYAIAPNVQFVVHTDTKATSSWCNERGKELARQGFPTRPHIELLKDVYQLCAKWQSKGKLRVCVSNPSYHPDRQSTVLARRLAKSAVEQAIVSTEKEDFYLNSHFGICVFDDGPRYNLRVPAHEHTYVNSKGAWWDDDEKTFFVYEYDVGCHYDMRRTDWVNLRKMFGVDEVDDE